MILAAGLSQGHPLERKTLRFGVEGLGAGNGRATERSHHSTIGKTSATQTMAGSQPRPCDHIASNKTTSCNRVNAPQRLRLFQFDGALAGTGGLRESASTQWVSADTGRGVLKIINFALTDPQPDAKARMTCLKYQACLTWPRLSEAEELARASEHERRARELDAQVLSFSAVEQETFYWRDGAVHAQKVYGMVPK